jgi:type II secretory pathway component GspD/PulD (secretin)
MTQRFTAQQTAFVGLLASILACQALPYQGMGQSAHAADAVSLSAPITVINGTRKVRVDVSNQPVRNVLRVLASKFNLNLAIDESVKGNVSLRLDNVTVDDALRAIADSANLEVIPKGRNVYLIIERTMAQARGIDRAFSRVLPVKYVNAQRMADVLNQSLFMDAASQAGGQQGGAGGQAGATGGAQGGTAPTRVQVDHHANAVIVVGTANDLKLAEALIAQVDKPRQSKTFYLSHANALNISALLAGSIFNDGNNLLRLGSSGGGGASGGAGGSGGAANANTPASLRVEQEDIQEGQGINSLGAGGGGGGAAGGGGNSPLSQAIVLRGNIKSTQTIQVSGNGPIVIPDTRTNSVTVMGSSEQLAQAEQLIATLDARLPQVSIEASLVEISEEGIREISNNLGISAGELQFGFNNVPLPLNQGAFPGLAGLTPGTGLTGLPSNLTTDTTGVARTGIGFSTRPLSRTDAYVTQVRALITKNKARVLANPSIVATHDTEAVISIVDEIIRSVVVNVNGLAGTVQNTVQIGEAGIILDILPKVGENQTVSLRIRPHVSSVREVTRDSLGNIITLLSKRDLLAQSVRMADGKTFLIGGLINQNETVREDKLPFLGDLPIVGALFRANRRDNRRTELVLLITPHILNQTIPTAPVTTTHLMP